MLSHHVVCCLSEWREFKNPFALFSHFISHPHTHAPSHNTLIVYPHASHIPSRRPTATLTSHIRTQSKNEKPFACNLCDFRTTHKNTLTRHARVHSGEKPYACDHCSFRATQKGVSPFFTKPFLTICLCDVHQYLHYNSGVAAEGNCFKLMRESSATSHLLLLTEVALAGTR